MTLQPLITFKTPELKDQLSQIDSRLRFFIFSLAGYVFYSFGKTIEMTELFRTQAQQDEYRKLNPSEPQFSPHTFGRASDISVKYYTKDEIDSIVNYMNKNIFYGDNIHQTVIHHNIGLGDHIHIGVSPAQQTLIEKLT